MVVPTTTEPTTRKCWKCGATTTNSFTRKQKKTKTLTVIMVHHEALCDKCAKDMTKRGFILEASQ